MKANLIMNFSIEKENKKIWIEREFSAPLDLVWPAWTRKEILDKWWAPKPWKTETKFMDFREGGFWLYAMVGPEGQKHWGRNDYKAIHDRKSISAVDAFCDEEGILNKNLPVSNWTILFRDKDQHTLMTIELTYDELEDLEKIIEMGFQEGFTAALENLDQYLEETKRNE